MGEKPTSNEPNEKSIKNDELSLKEQVLRSIRDGQDNQEEQENKKATATKRPATSDLLGSRSSRKKVDANRFSRRIEEKMQQQDVRLGQQDQALTKTSDDSSEKENRSATNKTPAKSRVRITRGGKSSAEVPAGENNANESNLFTRKNPEQIGFDRKKNQVGAEKMEKQATTHLSKVEETQESQAETQTNTKVTVNAAENAAENSTENSVTAKNSTATNNTNESNNENTDSTRSSSRLSSKKKETVQDLLKENNEMPTSERKKKVRQKENVFVRRIVAILILVFVVVLLIGGISFWNFWQSGQKPLDTANSTTELVEIPLGSSNKQIGAVLEENKIIKSAVVFNYYMKLHNQSGFQAGFYDLAPNMTLDQIASTLKAGDTVQQTLLIPEGYTIDQIGTAIEENTPYTKQDFMEVINDEAFFQAQLKKFPELLQSAADATDTRYHLEGYLFPATYTLTPGGEIDGLVAQMVQKSADVLSNYYDEIATRGITVQQMLTLASLTEKEGSKDEDRRNIAQVFYNRLAIDMPLQSDISVLYALDEHKELLTIEDTQVDSPYNLYANRGYGPGPFNSPSEASIQAVLYPQANDYYYFVADITTGIVYYARTLDEHNQLVAQYVNN